MGRYDFGFTVSSAPPKAEPTRYGTARAALLLGGRAFDLPAGAMVLPLPQIGIAIVKVRGRYSALGKAAPALGYSEADLRGLWSEFS